MLPLKYRFPLRRHQTIFARGSRVVTPSLIVYQSPLSDSDLEPATHFQAAVIVPKTVDKRATVRHKLQRQLLAWLHQNTTRLSGVLIVVARAKAKQLSPPQLATELEKLVNPSP